MLETSVNTGAFMAKANADDWKDYIIDGEPVGQVIDVRGTADEEFNTGFYRITGGITAFDYPITHNKTVHVVEGKMKIEVKDGETLILEPGDMASFTPGLMTRWEAMELPYQEMFVQS